MVELSPTLTRAAEEFRVDDKPLGGQAFRGISNVKAQHNIVILLAVWNGAKNLQAQLDSLRHQTVLPRLLIVSDDGSTDDSLEIIRAFVKSAPGFEVELRYGPGRGGAANFLSMLRDLPPDVDWLAFCDQDDVWLADKLSRGMRALTRGQMPGTPALVGGRSYICADDLSGRRLSRGLPKAPSFRHALVQNFAGGNTMMVNRAGADLLRAGANEIALVSVHDWWIYQMVAGAGGSVLFDDQPLLLYRQHPGNTIGANQGLLAKWRRFSWMVKGGFQRWNHLNLEALQASAHRFTPENKALLQLFIELRQSGLLRRLYLLYNAGLYRYRFEGKMALWLSALLGKI